MNAMPNRSLAGGRTLRMQVNEWISAVVVPVLANAAAEIEMAGRRVRDGDASVGDQIRAAIRARPLVSLLTIVLTGYLAGRVTRRR